MDKNTIERIATDRLKMWGKRIVLEHATPMFLLSIGHDHASGKVVLSCTEDEDLGRILTFLLAVASLLEADGVKPI